MTAVGQFVRITSNRLGVGKVVSAAEGEIEVEYFDSVAATGPGARSAHPGKIEHVPGQLAATLLLARRRPNGAWVESCGRATTSTGFDRLTRRSISGSPSETSSSDGADHTRIRSTSL